MRSPACATPSRRRATPRSPLSRIARRARCRRTALTRRVPSRSAMLPRAQEALYPLAAACRRSAATSSIRRCATTPISRRGSAQPAGENTGVTAPRQRAGKPRRVLALRAGILRPGRAWPLVMALHGGSGHGRAFLWSWLRDARSRGAILVAPTATGRTWALQRAPMPTPRTSPAFSRACAPLERRSGAAPAHRHERRRHVRLRVGPGGGVPFTHLAPVAAAFHPMMADVADPERLTGLPVFLVHGALDWMFPVAVARQAHRALSAAGARVTYRELDDLSHCYPREMNAAMLAWLDGG